MGTQSTSSFADRAEIFQTSPIPEPCTCGTACPCRSDGPHLYPYPPASRSVRSIQAAQCRTATVLTAAERLIQETANRIDEERVGPADTPLWACDLHPFEADVADPRPAALDWPAWTDEDVYELGPDYQDVADDLDPVLFNLIADIEADERARLDLTMEACFSLGRGAGYRGDPMQVPAGFSDPEATNWLLGWDAGRDERLQERLDRIADEEEINRRWAVQGEQAALILDGVAEEITAGLRGIRWAEDVIALARSNGGRGFGPDYDGPRGGEG